MKMNKRTYLCNGPQPRREYQSKNGCQCNGNDLIFDTGCSVTLIPEGEAKNIKLNETKCKFASYTGHDISVKRKQEAKVQYDGQEEKSQALYIVRGYNNVS